MSKQYTLGAPAHELAAEIQRDLYEQARSGVVDYGARSPIHELIIQFQESASNMNQILSGLQQTVNELVVENKRLRSQLGKPRTVELNPDVCVKCGWDSVITDTASGMRVCRKCGNAQ